MLGIKIQYKRKTNSKGFLDFDLRDILTIIGEPVKQSKWLCYDVCYTARRDDVFNEFFEPRLKFSGNELMQFAGDIFQTIDGRFEAKMEGAAKKSWLVIIADDSSWFEVWSSKPKIIEQLKEHFQVVSDLPTGLNP